MDDARRDVPHKIGRAIGSSTGRPRARCWVWHRHPRDQDNPRATGCDDHGIGWRPRSSLAGKAQSRRERNTRHVDRRASRRIALCGLIFRTRRKQPSLSPSRPRNETERASRNPPRSHSWRRATSRRLGPRRKSAHAHRLSFRSIAGRFCHNRRQCRRPPAKTYVRIGAGRRDRDWSYRNALRHAFALSWRAALNSNPLTAWKSSRTRCPRHRATPMVTVF